MSSDQQLLLIDADMVVFRALISTEVETNWGDDIWTLHTNENEAREKIARRLGLIHEALGGGKIVLCFSGSGNFRKALYPAYKGNRDGVRKPLGYKSIVDSLCDPEGWGGGVPLVDLEVPHCALRVDGIEADDAMGIIATKPGNAERSIIVSDDKDMLQIPTRIWRINLDGDPFSEGPRKIIHQTQEEADRFHLWQTLVGDQSDNYPGLPGCGPKTADKVLNGEPSWSSVVNAYENAGLTEEDALLQARLARILRASDWDAKAKKPKLWEPHR